MRLYSSRHLSNAANDPNDILTYPAAPIIYFVSSCYMVKRGRWPIFSLSWNISLISKKGLVFFIYGLDYMSILQNMIISFTGIRDKRWNSSIKNSKFPLPGTRRTFMSVHDPSKAKVYCKIDKQSLHLRYLLSI